MNYGKELQHRLGYICVVSLDMLNMLYVFSLDYDVIKFFEFLVQCFLINIHTIVKADLCSYTQALT